MKRWTTQRVGMVVSVAKPRRKKKIKALAAPIERVGDEAAPPGVGVGFSALRPEPRHMHMTAKERLELLNIKGVWFDSFSLSGRWRTSKSLKCKAKHLRWLIHDANYALVVGTRFSVIAARAAIVRAKRNGQKVVTVTNKRVYEALRKRFPSDKMPAWNAKKMTPVQIEALLVDLDAASSAAGLASMKASASNSTLITDGDEAFGRFGRLPKAAKARVVAARAEGATPAEKREKVNVALTAEACNQMRSGVSKKIVAKTKHRDTTFVIVGSMVVECSQPGCGAEIECKVEASKRGGKVLRRGNQAVYKLFIPHPTDVNCPGGIRTNYVVGRAKIRGFGKGDRITKKDLTSPTKLVMVNDSFSVTVLKPFIDLDYVPPLSVAEVRRQAEMEGLTLVTKDKGTGYLGVDSRPSGRFMARRGPRGRRISLGNFATAEEAALAVARDANARKGDSDAAPSGGTGATAKNKRRDAPSPTDEPRAKRDKSTEFDEAGSKSKQPEATAETVIDLGPLADGESMEVDGLTGTCAKAADRTRDLHHAPCRPALD